MKVLTYNCWGVFTAPECDGRLQELANLFRRKATANVKTSQKKEERGGGGDEARGGGYDMVILQELFDEQHWPMFRDGLKDIYPYAYRFQNGSIGNGLAFLSKYEIVSKNFMYFHVHGRPEKIFQGAYFCTKGVSFCRVKVPLSELAAVEKASTPSASSSTIFIDVYNIHTIACYESYSKDLQYDYAREMNAPMRISQLQQAMEFVECVSFGGKSAEECSGVNIIFAGDLNAGGPYSPELRFLRKYFELSSAVRNARSLSSTNAGKLRTLQSVFAHQNDESVWEAFDVTKQPPLPTFSPPGIKDSLLESTTFTYSDENFHVNPEMKLPVSGLASWFDEMINKACNAEDRPVQLDHFLYSSEIFIASHAKVCLSENIFPMKVGEKVVQVPLSDHYGIEATFELIADAGKGQSRQKKNSQPAQTIGNTISQLSYFQHILHRGFHDHSVDETYWKGKFRLWPVLALVINVSFLLLLVCYLGMESQEENSSSTLRWRDGYVQLSTSLSRFVGLPVWACSAAIFTVAVAGVLLQGLFTFLCGGLTSSCWFLGYSQKPDYAMVFKHQGHDLAELMEQGAAAARQTTTTCTTSQQKRATRSRSRQQSLRRSSKTPSRK